MSSSRADVSESTFDPAFLRSCLLMIAAACFFALMSALIRLGSEELHPFQIAFFRNVFGLAFMLPLVAKAGLGSLRTDRLGLYMLRAVVGATTMLAFFWTLSTLPLATAISLSFTAPLFVTIGAALCIGEQVRARRWTATLVGFAGTLIILRPGSKTLSLPALVALGAACAMAASVLIIKVLSRTEPSNAIVTWMVLLMTPISLVPALFVWEWPSLQTWGIVAVIGGFGTAGHMLFTRAIQSSDASLVMPFDFVRLPLVAALGYLFFDQSVDLWTWIGATIIFSSGVYIARREGRRKPRTPAAPKSLSETAGP